MGFGGDRGGGRGFGGDRGGGRGFGGGRGGGRGFGGGRGGGRGGFGNRDNYGPPEEVIIVGQFTHSCEDDIVCSNTSGKIPYFNAPIYFENKEEVGKIDEIFGGPQDSGFTVKLSGGVKSASFESGQQVYIDPAKLLPVERFTGQQQRGGRGRGGDRGRGGRGGGFRGGDRGGRGGGFRGGDRGGFRGGDRGGFRGGDRGGFRGGDRGGFRGGDRGGFRGGDRGGFRGGDRGGFRGDRGGGFKRNFDSPAAGAQNKKTKFED